VTEQPLGGGAAFWAARGVRIEPEPDSAAESDSDSETEIEAEAEIEAETEAEDAAEDSDAEDTDPEGAEAEPGAGVEPLADGAAVSGFPQQRARDEQPGGLAAAAGGVPAQSAPAASAPAVSAAAASAPAASVVSEDFSALGGPAAGAVTDAATDGASGAETGAVTDAAGEPVWQLTGGELANPLPPLKTCLEAILMVVDEPIPVVSLAQVLERPTAEVAEALIELAEEYTVLGRGFELREVGLTGDGSRTGWRVYSRADCAPVVERFVRDGQQAKLTQAALETLAVVAYRQPVSRSKVSAIRGVNCDGVMRTLLARGLVEEYGADPETGALLYQTTGYFLERMGLKSLDELPELAPLLPSAAEIDSEDFA
jgi:segregation and condensation protein B